MIAALVAVLAVGAAQARSTAAAGAVEQDTVLAAEIADRVGDLRAKRGLRRVAPSAGLARGARAHAVSMARNGYFSHTSLDGSSVERRVAEYYGGGTDAVVGEVLFWTVGSASADEIVETWLSSSLHRSVLLFPRWQDVGVSVLRVRGAPGAFGDRDVTIAVADFGGRG